MRWGVCRVGSVPSYITCPPHQHCTLSLSLLIFERSLKSKKTSHIGFFLPFVSVLPIGNCQCLLPLLLPSSQNCKWVRNHNFWVSCYCLIPPLYLLSHLPSLGIIQTCLSSPFLYNSSPLLSFISSPPFKYNSCCNSPMIDLTSFPLFTRIIFIASLFHLLLGGGTCLVSLFVTEELL